MGVAASCLMSFAALLLFALAMDRHHRQAFRRPPSRRIVLTSRGAGAVLLAAAPAPWMLEQGPTMGLVTWLFCGLPLAGVAVVALFTRLGATDRS